MGAILLLLVWQWFLQPAIGHQEKVSLPMHAKTAAHPATSQAPASDLDNSYFSLALPAGFVPQSSQSPSAGLLYSQTIIKPGAGGSLIISIGISNLPAGGLKESSSYRLRAQQTQTYKLTEQTINGANVTVAARNDGAGGEVVAFLPHGSYLATIGITSGVQAVGGGDTAGNQAVLSQLLQLWQWR